MTDDFTPVPGFRFPPESVLAAIRAHGTVQHVEHPTGLTLAELEARYIEACSERDALAMHAGRDTERLDALSQYVCALDTRQSDGREERHERPYSGDQPFREWLDTVIDYGLQHERIALRRAVRHARHLKRRGDA